MDTHIYASLFESALSNKQRDEEFAFHFFIVYQHSVSFTNYMVRHADIVQTFVLLILDSPTMLVQWDGEHDLRLVELVTPSAGLFTPIRNAKLYTYSKYYKHLPYTLSAALDFSLFSPHKASGHLLDLWVQSVLYRRKLWALKSLGADST